MKKQYLTIWIALCINVSLFVLFFIFYFPIYDSKEDVFAAYLLSGGFGNAPTNFLHYNYGLHPYLTWIIKELFLVTDKFNWYSFVLIFAHFISCTVILWLLLRKSPKLFTLLAYIAFFLVFEGSFLIIPDFTGVSIVLTAAAAGYLLAIAKDNDWKRGHVICIILLFLLASFFRMHTMLPVIGLSIPFLLWAGNRQSKIKAVATLLAAGAFILLFNWFQQLNYTAKDPGWRMEEKRRDKIYQLYDFHALELFHVQPGEKWHTESGLIARGLICDSVVFSNARVDSLYHDLTNMKIAKPPLPGNWLKWFWINNRLFFCLLAFFILLYGTAKRVRLPLLLSLVCLAAGTLYLLYTAKLPSYVFTGCLYFLCLAIFIGNEVSPVVYTYRYGRSAILIIGLLFIVWGAVRQYKSSMTNKEKNQFFKAVYAEVNSNPEKLFIVTENFPIHNFYAFEVPAQYKLPNYLDTEHFIMNIYYPVLHRYGLASFADIPKGSTVYFWGKPSDELTSYFIQATGKDVLLSEPLKKFRFGEVRSYKIAAE